MADLSFLAFHISQGKSLSALFREAGVTGAEIIRQEGIACFPSLRAWLSIEIKEWTLADRINNNQIEAFLTEVAALLQLLVAIDGAVAVPAPPTLLSRSRNDASEVTTKPATIDASITYINKVAVPGTFRVVVTMSKLNQVLSWEQVKKSLF